MSSTTPADTGPAQPESAAPSPISVPGPLSSFFCYFVVALVCLSGWTLLWTNVEAIISPLVCISALLLWGAWLQETGVITRISYAALACFVVLGCVIPGSGFAHVVNSALLVGWIAFLVRVIPEVSWYIPALAAGVALVILLLGGIHALGLWLSGSQEGGTAVWKWRWSFAIVVGLAFMFAAGLSAVGMLSSAEAIWELRR